MKQLRISLAEQETMYGQCSADAESMLKMRLRQAGFDLKLPIAQETDPESGETLYWQT